LRNILTVFAKLNPGIRYVQGMNEILAPLFYIFKNDPDEEMAVSSCCCFLLCQKDILLLNSLCTSVEMVDAEKVSII
jgi:hypothetical protein